MSDACHTLYEPGEKTTCMCTKCGWLGTADAPMFLCGGCKKYLTRPMDLTDRKLAAAEARVAELETALKPFEQFATRCKRMLEMDPDHKVTQGSPMAAPQLYAHDFLALLAALQKCAEQR